MSPAGPARGPRPGPPAPRARPRAPLLLGALPATPCDGGGTGPGAAGGEARPLPQGRAEGKLARAAAAAAARARIAKRRSGGPGKMLSPLQKCGSEGCLLDCDFLPWHRSNLRKRQQSCEEPRLSHDHEEQNPEKLCPPSIRLEVPEATGCSQPPLQDPGGVWRCHSEGRLDQKGAPCREEAEVVDKTGSGWSLPSPKSLRKERRLRGRVAAAKQHLRNIFGGSSKSLASSVESDLGSEGDSGQQTRQRQKHRRKRNKRNFLRLWSSGNQDMHSLSVFGHPNDEGSTEERTCQQPLM